MTPILLLAAALVAPVDPPDEAGYWVGRVGRLAGAGWTVAAAGDDLVLTRDRPVRLVDFPINAPPGEPARPPRAEACRIRLRFSDRVAIAAYDRIVAANAAARVERDRLRSGLGLPEKFGEFSATTPEEVARLARFRAEEARFPIRDVPDLYTPDRSITVFRSWGPFSGLADDESGREVREVVARLTRLFGVYSPDVAEGREEVGRDEPTAR